MAILAGPVLRCAIFGAAGIEDAVLDLGAHEALVAGELGLGEELLHPTGTSSDGSPRLPGPAIPPDAT